MCSFITAANTGLQIVGNYLGQRSTAKQAQAQIDAQAKHAITEMNYAYQNYEQERADAFDSAVAEMTRIRHNAAQLNSSVKVAVNENATGRTADMLIRSVEGDTARAISSVKDNYTRKSNEIDLNEDATFKSTSSYINNLNASAPKMPSRFANLMSSTATIMDGITMGLNQKNAVQASGQKYNWWTGGAKGTGTFSSTGKTWVGNTPRTTYEKKGIGVGKYF